MRCQRRRGSLRRHHSARVCAAELTAHHVHRLRRGHRSRAGDRADSGHPQELLGRRRGGRGAETVRARAVELQIRGPTSAEKVFVDHRTHRGLLRRGRGGDGRRGLCGIHRGRRRGGTRHRRRRAERIRSCRNGQGGRRSGCRGRRRGWRTNAECIPPTNRHGGCGSLSRRRRPESVQSPGRRGRGSRSSRSLRSGSRRSWSLSRRRRPESVPSPGRRGRGSRSSRSLRSGSRRSWSLSRRRRPESVPSRGRRGRGSRRSSSCSSAKEITDGLRWLRGLWRLRHLRRLRSGGCCRLRLGRRSEPAESKRVVVRGRGGGRRRAHGRHRRCGVTERSVRMRGVGLGLCLCLGGGRSVAFELPLVEHLPDEVFEGFPLGVLHQGARALVGGAVPPREVPGARGVVSGVLHRLDLLGREVRVADGLDAKLKLAVHPRTRGAHEGAEGGARVLRRAAAVALARHALSVTLELGQFAQDLLVLGVLTRGERGGRHGGSRRISAVAKKRITRRRAWNRRSLEHVRARDALAKRERGRGRRGLAAGPERPPSARGGVMAPREARSPRASPPSPKPFPLGNGYSFETRNHQQACGRRDEIRNPALCSSLDARRSFFASADRSPRSALAAWRRASAR